MKKERDTSIYVLSYKNIKYIWNNSSTLVTVYNTCV